MQETWLERARRGTPIVEGDTATFVWLGPEAPQLIGDWTGGEGGSPVDLAPVAPGVWTYTLTLPPDAYLEYAFKQGGARVADPFNPHSVPDGLGRRNHFFYMPGATPTPLTRRQPGVPHGSHSRHVVRHGFFVTGGTRAVELYRPPGAGPFPLLVVLDGQDYGPRGKIVQIVENLTAQRRIHPLALALVDHGRQARGVEYACSEATLAFLLWCVLPLAQSELPLLDLQAQPGAYGILGASMGGLMALFAGLRAPDTFGRVLIQSGAFDFAEGEPVIWDLIRHGPVRPVRLWITVGRYEWLLDCNGRLHNLLVTRGYDVAYRECSSGHNYTAWRNELPSGLECLFPVLMS